MRKDSFIFALILIIFSFLTLNYFLFSFAEIPNNPFSSYSILLPKLIIPEWAQNLEKESISNMDAISIAQEDTQIIVPNKLYSTTVYVNTTPSLLAQIKNVTYILHPTFDPNIVTKNQSQNKFANFIQASGIFTIRSDIQFLNGSKTYSNLLVSPGREYIFPNLPPYITLDDPTFEQNNITLNGKVTYSGNLSRIQVDEAYAAVMKKINSLEQPFFN